MKKILCLLIVIILFGPTDQVAVGQIDQKIKSPVVKKGKKTHVFATVTAYNAEVGQTDSTPTITAFGTKVKHRTIAVSRDLHKKGWTVGKKVVINGDVPDKYKGVYVINDLMNKRYKRSIDIFMWKKREAKKFGRNHDVSVTLIAHTSS